MADYDSSLPIRSEKDGTDERVHVKIVDYNDPDGAGKQADVTDGNVHVYAKGQDAAGDEKMLRTSEQGAPVIDGVYDGTNNTDPSQMGLVGMERNASPADSQQTLRVTAKANVAGDVRAIDVAIRAADGEVFSTTNPLPVFVAGSASGDEVLDFDQGSSIAAGSSSSHTYTPTAGKVLTLQKIQMSGSARSKFEIKIGTTGSEVLKLVFFNSTSNPNCEYKFGLPQAIADTESIVIVRTNIDKQASDVYSTIEGLNN